MVRPSESSLKHSDIKQLIFLNERRKLSFKEINNENSFLLIWDNYHVKITTNTRKRITPHPIKIPQQEYLTLSSSQSLHFKIAKFILCWTRTSMRFHFPLSHNIRKPSKEPTEEAHNQPPQICPTKRYYPSCKNSLLFHFLNQNQVNLSTFNQPF